LVYINRIFPSESLSIKSILFYIVAHKSFIQKTVNLGGKELKVLRILINGQDHRLVNSFVSYLVDVGHQVYLAISPKQITQWQKLYYHGIEYIEEDSPLPKVDYVVDLGVGFEELTAAKILFTIENKNNNLEISSWLRIRNNEFLIKKHIHCLPNPISVDAITEDLTELFIDTVVILSRLDQPENELVPKNLCRHNKLYEFMDFFEKAESVHRYNAPLQSSEYLYNGQELCNFSLESPTSKVVSFKANSIHPNDVQILSLALMMIFNGRQEGVYVFDYFQSVSWPITKVKKIPKFIELNYDDSYATLCNKLEKPYSLIFDNFFYCSSALTENITIPVSVYYNALTEQNKPFSISYKEGDSTLQIRANKVWLESTDIIQSFDTLINNFKFFKNRKITFSELLQLNEDSYYQALVLSNETSRELSEKTLFLEFLEKNAEATPNKIAARLEDQTLTYAELNHAANQLAHFLKSHCHSNSNFFAALYMERSLFMLISLLAVMKAGGTYIPLDLRYPDQRIEAIIHDSEPHFILTNEAYCAKLENIISKSYPSSSNKSPFILSVDAKITQNKISTYSNCNPQGSNIRSHDLAYVIYTSGTTGIPKGVMIEHKSLVNLLISVGQHINFNETDRLLAVTTVAFDIAALELYLPLLKGGEVIIAKESDILAPQKLISLINKYKISVIQATPSLYSVMMPFLKNLNSNIRLLCGGEDLPYSLAKSLLQYVKQLWNVYGPTETTIWSTIKELKKGFSQVSIGKALANTMIYVLDSRGKMLPAGAVGELYIAGLGLARGYLKKPKLTAQQFVPCPFKYQDKRTYNAKKRMYKTGDLVRQLANGDIQYISRKDFQVKINGFRIELGEIENAIANFPGIKSNVVEVKNNEEKLEQGEISKHIVAYYVADEPVNEKELVEFLRQKLPEYMIPSFFSHIHEMPLSINGKINRKALPEPAIQSQINLQPPRSELEERLWHIWSDVLGLEKDRPDINSDFFRSGGNSIFAIRLVNRINSELQSDIKISDIFQFRTIESLSSLVQKTRGKFLYEDFVVQEINHDKLFETYPLNNVQQAYVLGRVNNFELSSVSTHIYTEYSFGFLDLERLEKAFNRLLQRHLALRTVFNQNIQYYLKEYPYYNISIVECTDENDVHKTRDVLSHKLYDIEAFPLFDIVVSKFKNKYILHISFDALIVDMGSFQILFDEWIKLYNNLDISLPELYITHRDYALQYDLVRQSPLFNKAKQYWEGKVENYNFDVNLPLRTYPSAIDTPRFSRITKTIPHTIWQKLIQKAQQRHISPTALVLEVYGHILSYWMGQEKLCINLTLFNRLPLHPQINDVIGDFTVLELFDYQNNDKNSTIADELQRTHRALLLDIENNLFDGIDFQRLVRKKRSINVNQILAPIVLTSVLGNISQGKSIFDLPLNESYQGVNFSLSQTPQVWLDNKAYETDEGFVAEWDYVEQLFDRDIISSMHASYCDLIEKLANMDWDNQTLPAPNLPYYELIQQGNSSSQKVCEETLHDRYSKVYHKTKTKIAVVDIGAKREYTHQELWDESELLARYLIEFMAQHKLSLCKLVAVLSQKGYNQVIATLAIMKAGCAYLPLNTDWPVGRLNSVMEQGECEVLLVSEQEMTEKGISQNMQGKYILVIEDVLRSLRTLDNQSLLATISLPNVNADDIAYVIFTSGSTGKPKGVTISHRGALNTIDAVNRRFRVKSNDKVLALSELSFDLSVYDIFGLLAVGGTIVFPRQEEVKHPKHWLELVQKYKITLWNTVPQLASLFMDEAEENKSDITSLKVFLLSGDWIPLSLPPRIQKLCPRSIVMSLGGATEGSIWSIWHEIKDVDPQWASIPYGVAMPNQKMYILNPHREHCPIGVVGEICIGGIGVALNYWGDSELTEEKFIRHTELGRLYKTGDLGKWNKNGQIEFLGRKDFQVKIRGYRVELGEIESVLSQIPGVDKAVLNLQRDNGLDHLIAYIVPKHKYQNGSDIEAFKLEQKGLLNFLGDFKYIHHSVEENKYRLRKSYRRFLDEDIKKEALVRVVKSIIHKNKLKIIHPLKVPTKVSLSKILSTISALDVENKALPKYRYPSAGSSYGVRCFVKIHNDIDDLRSGYYYYHPTKYGLVSMESPFDQEKELIGEVYELHLVVNWPSIRSLYGDFSKKLAFIEAGHMLSLLIDELEANNIGYVTTIVDQDFDRDNSHILTVKIGGGEQQAPQADIGIDLLYREGLIYQTNNKGRVFDIDRLDVFTKANDLGGLLQAGKALLTASAEPSSLNYIVSGMVFQKISEALYSLNIGSCALGFAPFEDTLYGMVLGSIDEQDKYEWETKVECLSLREIINAKISHVLPDYMLPADYVLIDTLPLSVNGKLDLSQLPKYKVSSQHIAPKTMGEIKVAKVWSDVLGIPLEKIGITDRFFELGGNSLSAMQTVRRLNKDLGMEIKLNDLYKYNTIKLLLKNFSTSTKQTLREEGIL